MGAASTSRSSAGVEGMSFSAVRVCNVKAGSVEAGGEVGGVPDGASAECSCSFTSVVRRTFSSSERPLLSV